MKKFFILLMAVVFIAASQIARAETPPVTDMPSKESLISAWEDAQRKNPQIKTFEKTADPTVYNVEMNIFPYKGRLKVLNAFIQTSPYYEAEEDYVPDVTASYTGIVETDLPDAPPDFPKKLEASYYAWKRTNTLYFDKKAGEWVTALAWRERALASQKAAIEKAKASSTCPRPAAAATWAGTHPELMAFFMNWGPMILLIGAWLWICIKPVRRHRKIVDRSMELSEENLGLQRQNNQLLKDILSALQRK